MSGTPGQAAYEERRRLTAERIGEALEDFGVPWERQSDDNRAIEEAAAQAAIAAAPPAVIHVRKTLTKKQVAELREQFAKAVRNERPRILADDAIITARNPWTERAAEILTEEKP